jgi:hypothetical protein
MSVARHLCLISAATLMAVACSSTPKPDPAKSEPVASPAAANEKLGGYWLLSMQRGGQSTDHSLHIALTAGELVGSLTSPDGNSREITKVALAGDKVTWEIASSSQNGMVQRYEGKLTGASSMEGSIKMVRAQRGSRKGGGGQGSGSSGSDSGDSSGSSGDGTAPSDGGGSSSGGSGGYSGHGGRGGHGRGGRGGSGGTTVTWRAYKSVELPAIPAPTPSKAEL